MESQPVIPSDGITLFGAESMYINICKHTVKFSNSVLVSVLINNYNYKQPLTLFVILQA